MAQRTWRAGMGRVNIVRNTKPRPAANRHYAFVRVQYPNGREVNWMATGHQMRVMEDRAKKNPEDVLKPRLLQDWAD